MNRDEKRFLRRELIQWHLKNSVPNWRTLTFVLRDIKFLVRNGEIYRYKQTLNIYSKEN